LNTQVDILRANKGGDHLASYRLPAQSLEYCFVGY
jgi:hypothetical protein